MDTIRKKLHKGLGRVDVQAALLAVALTICSSVFIYGFYYKTTYNEMIKTLEMRTESIHQYLEQVLVEEDFDAVNTIQDADSLAYQRDKKLLGEIRKATGVRYLYTAKKNTDGKYIYVVDGLEESSPDFRNPGDPIEKEIIADIERAYQGEVVLPDKILETSWGKIFLAYYPIHKGDAKDSPVIGVMGVEFDAEEQYNAYRRLEIISPIIIIAMCILAGTIAKFRFRRLSNPLSKDMYNTDMLTQMKNRNAFDIDMGNQEAEKKLKNIGVGVIDLDYLKAVNDHYGHSFGDEYIKRSAEAIREGLARDAWAYRTGGDEFVVMMANASKDKMEELINRIQSAFERKMQDFEPETSFSAGYAIHDGDEKISIYNLVEQADTRMYQKKHEKGKERKD